MSKMGNVILEIQELAHMGIPNKEIAKKTKTSLDFVDRIVEDMFEWDGPLHEEDA